MFRMFSCRLLLFPGVLALAGVLMPSGNAQQAGSSLRKHFLAAQQDQQQGNLNAAALEYKTVLRLQPGLPEVYVNLGLVYYAQSKFDESAHALATAQKLRPGMRGVSLWLGIDDIKLRRPIEGTAHLREAIRQNPADKLAQSWLATALWDAGQIDAALLQLRATNVRFSNDPDLLFALGEAYGKAATQETRQLLEESSGTALSDLIYGITYAEEREWSKAEKHLRRAIERDPHILEARLQLADVFLRQAHLLAAQEQLDQALTLTPQSSAVLARSGELLILMQQPVEGLSRISKAMGIDRGEAFDALELPIEDNTVHRATDAELFPLCYEAAKKLKSNSNYTPSREVALAALYALANDENSARDAYQRIFPAQSTPNAPVSLFVQAMRDLHQHHYDDAEPLFVRWIAAHPDNRMARYQLILVRRQISMAQIARLLAVAPDSYHVHQLLGQFYVDLTMADEASDGLQEDDKAMAEYFAVAAARPDLPNIHFWLGHLYWKHGDADHAFAELKRELELDPAHPEANGEFGAVLVAQGHAVEAVPHLESAIRNMPDLWPAYLELGKAYAIEKDYNRAEEVLKRALAHDQNGSIHYQLGLVLRAEGKTSQAIELFAQVRAIKEEKMIKLSSDDVVSDGVTK
jgi:tetratricopeptide (TPR) repeat protein